MSSSSSSANSALSVTKELWKQLQQQNDDNDDDTAASLDRFQDLVARLQSELDNVPSHKLQVVEKTLTAACKSFRRKRRTETNAVKEQWDNLLQQTELMSKTLRESTKQKQTAGKGFDAEGAAADVDDKVGLPSSTSVYLARLKSQKKELYKSPPVLPPAKIVIQSQTCPLPSRNKKTGELSFVPGQDGDDSSIQSLLKDFHPNVTPEEVLRQGAFGGTYFRSIVSAVTGRRYTSAEALKETLPKEWIHGLDRKKLLTSQTYQPHVNKFGVKCGGSLGMWESSGWISDADPYGWFQWYCRFYQGRRCSDDKRQISRWLKCAGPKAGRFRSQLCNKILAAGTNAGDATISPVIRQTLLHWGLDVTEHVLDKHRRRTR